MESEPQELEAELKSLQKQLERNQRVARKLREQRSGYGELHVPVALEIELEETEKEVARLHEEIARVETKRAGLPEGEENRDRSGVKVPNNLPFAEKGEAFKQFAVRGSRFAVKTPPLSSSRSQSFAL